MGVLVLRETSFYNHRRVLSCWAFSQWRENDRKSIAWFCISINETVADRIFLLDKCAEWPTTQLFRSRWNYCAVSSNFSPWQVRERPCLPAYRGRHHNRRKGCGSVFPAAFGSCFFNAGILKWVPICCWWLAFCWPQTAAGGESPWSHCPRSLKAGVEPKTTARDKFRKQLFELSCAKVKLVHLCYPE